MLTNGIINPAILSLLGRTRHRDTLLIADGGFPSFPGVETIDISLVAGTPRVVDVLREVLKNFRCARAVMASEFQSASTPETLHIYREVLVDVPIDWEPHAGLKSHATGVVGIIRTGDTTRFGNVLLESASLAAVQKPQP